MSNAIRYDPILVHYLAGELDARLKGRVCADAPSFDPDGSATLDLEGGQALRFDLHPLRGTIRILRTDEADDGDLDATIERVEAPEDERVLYIHLKASGRFTVGRRTLAFELATNQWNAIVIGEHGRIVSLLHGRRSRARTLSPGAEYRQPPSRARYGSGDVDRDEAWAHWRSRIGDAPADRRLATLLSDFAWTGPVNAAWILGLSGDDPTALAADRPSQHSGELRERHFDLAAAFERWWWLRQRPEASPVLLRFNGAPQPYPFALKGIESDPVDSLLEAMNRAASVMSVGSGSSARPVPTEIPASDAMAGFVDTRLRAAERKLASLRRQQEMAEGNAGIREIGDLLLAKLHEVPRGATVARLVDWNGIEHEIALDPDLTPAENAERYYEKARRQDRAEARIPDLIETAANEVERWRAARGDLAEGTVPDWVATEYKRRSVVPRSARVPTTSLPYRIFRTSGGLEVRVGRGGRENDRLTFQESLPSDVWLHARSVPGAHVVLRWSDPEGSPPARDLEEAAQLAAVYSRARTSGLVPVDWTRRKYVRKPRGAPPGTVIPQRVRTIFVEPDEAIIERLAVD